MRTFWSPGQKPKLMTSCEYASRVTASAFGIAGARVPLKRVTARSNPCQKRCTGLVLPQNQPANSCSVQSIQRSACQNRSTASRSYDACSVSLAKGVVTGIPNGSALVSTSIPRLASSAKKRSWKAATERPSASGKESTSPRLVRTTSSWATKSKETSKSSSSTARGQARVAGSRPHPGELDLEGDLVHITPAPVLPRLERADDGVLRRPDVRRGMAVWRGVTTADVPARKTEAQMDPPAADAQTVLAARDALGERRHLNRVEMRADVRHSFSSPSGKSARRSSGRSKEPRCERPSTKIVGVPMAPLARALERSASTRSR